MFVLKTVNFNCGSGDGLLLMKESQFVRGIKIQLALKAKMTFFNQSRTNVLHQMETTAVLLNASHLNLGVL